MDIRSDANDLVNSFFGEWSEEPLADSEAEDAKAFTDLADGDEDYSTLLCAYISHSGRCGFARSGAKAYAVNRHNNRSVRVTIRVRWRSGINGGTFERSHRLNAGARVLLGCTRGEGVRGGFRSYSVIGCEPL